MLQPLVAKMLHQLASATTTAAPAPCARTTSFTTTNNNNSSPTSDTVVVCYSGSSSGAKMLACSALIRSEHGDLMHTRKLCEDRRPVFDHLKPNKFVRNAIRIAVMQTTTAVTHYYNDQLKVDMEREDRISSGEITRAQAEKEDEAWQEREWNRRMEAIVPRIGVAFAKYHSIVLVMRLYEYIASRFVDEETLDKLTMDTFECAKRSAQIKEGGELASAMLGTCWRANMISFLADYSVHQVILAYGYYVYIQEQRRRLRLKDGSGGGELHRGSLALSFLKKSTLLAMSRGVGLGFSSLGGAIGSVVWPGWGTMAGSNLGDSVALQLTEDVESPSSS